MTVAMVPVPAWLRRNTAALASGPIAQAATASMALRLLGLVFAFAQGVLAARLLGAEQLGRAMFALSLAQVAGFVATLGLAGLAVRLLPAAQARGQGGLVQAYLNFSVVAVAGSGLLLAGLVWLAAPHTRDPADVALAALAVVPLALLALLRGLAQGLGRIIAAQLPSDVLRPLLLCLALLAWMAWGQAAGAGTFILLSAGLAAVAALGAGWACLRAAPREVPSDMPNKAGWLGQAIPFLGLGLLGLLQGELATLLLGWLAGPVEAGLFQPVARLLPILVLPAQAAAMGFSPAIAALWEQAQTARIANLTRKFTGFTAALTALIALAMVAGGPWIMALFGPDFTAAAPLLAIVATAQLFNALCGPLGPLLAMTGRTGTMLAGMAFGLAVNLGTGLWLIPAMGAQGAAIAMAAGVVAWNLPLALAVRRHTGIDPTILALLRRGGA